MLIWLTFFFVVVAAAAAAGVVHSLGQSLARSQLLDSVFTLVMHLFNSTVAVVIGCSDHLYLALC